MKNEAYLKIFGVIFLVIILFIIFFMVRDVQDVDSKNIDSLLNLKMKFLQTPKLNDTIDIELKVSSFLETTNIKEVNTTVKLFLPEGFKYINGDLKFLKKGVNKNLKLFGETFLWEGTLKKNEVKILNVKVKAVKSGELWVVLSTILTKIGKSQDVKNHLLYVTFDEDSGKIFEENEVDFPVKFNGTTKTK